MLAQSSQDRSAQTRIQNDQQRAQTSQIASRSVRASMQQPSGGDSRVQGKQQQAPAPSQMQSQQPQRPTSGIPAHLGPGPQPVGELGEFLKSINQQQQMQQPVDYQAMGMQGGGGEQQLAKQNMDVEEFLQSPALQEAIARTKLTQYFKQYKGNSVDYANGVLSNMDRYR